jgi:hypothetical protein
MNGTCRGEISNGASSLVLTSLTSASTAPIELIHRAEEEIAPVYDLTVEGLHNYFAAGVLVHNKARCWTNPAGCYVCADSTSQTCVPPGRVVMAPIVPPASGSDAGWSLDGSPEAATDAVVD